jgi:hypothetical protein
MVRKLDAHERDREVIIGYIKPEDSGTGNAWSADLLRDIPH